LTEDRVPISDHALTRTVEQNKAMKIMGWIVAGAVAAMIVLVAAFVAINWAPDRSVAELAARWAPPPSTFIDVAGMKVHLRDEGPRDDPAPIVLLHGTSASLHTWEGWVAALKERRRVIRFDLPGFGLTGPSPDEDYSLENNVRFVTAMLDKLGVRHCVLGGNSFGGNIAWRTALTRPERVDKLILVDAGGYAFAASLPPLGFRIAQWPVLNRLFEFTLPRGLVETSVRAVYGDPDKVTSALVDRYYEIALREGNRRALTQRFAQARPGELADRIPELKQPTLILWGGRDGLIPVEAALRFHRGIPGSRLVTFDDLGHVPHEEDPARTVAAAKEFLGIE
jgi:pimeloyl-ACP methyl ester carboxylesterase